MLGKNWIKLSIILFSLSKIAIGQSVYAPLNTDYYHIIDRMEVKGGELNNKLNSTVKPFQRSAIIDLVTKIDTLFDTKQSKVDKANYEYIINDNWDYFSDDVGNTQKALFGFLYKKRNDTWYFKNEDFNIHISPVLNFQFGKSDQINKSQFTNTRGVEVRGMINEKLGFYSYFSDNQRSMSQYETDFNTDNNAIPYIGFVKIDTSNNSYKKLDYFDARGYIAFRPIKNLQLQFGHDKNFVGDGIRSMVLSDFSAPSLNFKAQLQLGRFNYLWLISRMANAQEELEFNDPIPPKNLAFHYLSFNFTKNFALGLFETVAFEKRKTGYDLNYLNPVIFYRYIEGNVGSPDNVLIGGTLKWNIARTATIYGQLVLDELNIKKNNERDYWLNKKSSQIGLKYFDVFGLNNVDFQFEFNTARPYTYSHFSTYSNYVNYNLAIANPVGSNFKELLFQLRLQPYKKLFITANYANIRKGIDTDSLNYGGNILRLNTDNRAHDYDNYTLQGQLTKVSNFQLNVNYRIFHNLFLEGTYIYRKQDYPDSDPIIENKKESFYNIGLRFNIGRTPNLF